MFAITLLTQIKVQRTVAYLGVASIRDESVKISIEGQMRMCGDMPFHFFACFTRFPASVYARFTSRHIAVLRFQAAQPTFEPFTSNDLHLFTLGITHDPQT